MGSGLGGLRNRRVLCQLWDRLTWAGVPSPSLISSPHPLGPCIIHRNKETWLIPRQGRASPLVSFRSPNGDHLASLLRPRGCVSPSRHPGMGLNLAHS